MNPDMLMLRLLPYCNAYMIYILRIYGRFPGSALIEMNDISITLLNKQYKPFVSFKNRSIAQLFHLQTEKSNNTMFSLSLTSCSRDHRGAMGNPNDDALFAVAEICFFYYSYFIYLKPVKSMILDL